jgi:hypothetical protein
LSLSYLVLNLTLKIYFKIFLKCFFFASPLQMRKLLGRRPALKESIVRVVDNEVDFQEGIVRVNAPQFHLASFPVQLDQNTTAADVILR